MPTRGVCYCVTSGGHSELAEPVCWGLCDSQSKDRQEDGEGGPVGKVLVGQR